jgi:radical SAM protein (TIGR01212 family)
MHDVDKSCVSISGNAEKRFGNGRFYSANDYYRELFGEKVIKLSLDGGFTCPNRDGTLSSGGCIFCSTAGSGDFAGSRNITVKEQYEQMKQRLAPKWGYGKYMAYFQAFTNTYAPVERLRFLYYQAIEPNDVVALSVATRPDCLADDVVELLSEISKKVYVCVELGLQTSNEKTSKLINRCYDNSVYESAVKKLKNAGIDVITHIILGLPGETIEDMQATADYAVACGTNGIKLQLLHVLKNTKLAEMYANGEFDVFTQDAYIKTVVDILERIPQHIVIHRLTGDGAKSELIEPWWSLNKRAVLNGIMKEFSARDSRQGMKCTQL